MKDVHFLITAGWNQLNWKNKLLLIKKPFTLIKAFKTSEAVILGKINKYSNVFW